VSKAAYLGSHMEYWVAADGLSKELFVIDHDVAAPFAVGDTVDITLAPGGVTLVSQR